MTQMDVANETYFHHLWQPHKLMMQFVLLRLICLKREVGLGTFVLHLCAFLILLEGVIYKRSNEINSHNCRRKNSRIIYSHAKRNLKLVKWYSSFIQEVFIRARNLTHIIQGAGRCIGDGAILQLFLSFRQFLWGM